LLDIFDRAVTVSADNSVKSLLGIAGGDNGEGKASVVDERVDITGVIGAKNLLKELVLDIFVDEVSLDGVLGDGSDFLVGNSVGIGNDISTLLVDLSSCTNGFTRAFSLDDSIGSHSIGAANNVVDLVILLVLDLFNQILTNGLVLFGNFTEARLDLVNHTLLGGVNGNEVLEVVIIRGIGLLGDIDDEDLLGDLSHGKVVRVV